MQFSLLNMRGINVNEVSSHRHSPILQPSRINRGNERATLRGERKRGGGEVFGLFDTRGDKENGRLSLREKRCKENTMACPFHDDEGPDNKDFFTCANVDSAHTILTSCRKLLQLLNRRSQTVDGASVQRC